MHVIKKGLYYVQSKYQSILYKSNRTCRKNLDEFCRTQTNTLSCLKGYFSVNNVDNQNKNALKSISQGDNMKFQGKTIFKNKRCNTWYTRYRIDGKQYYVSGKSQQEVLTLLKKKLNYIKKEKSKELTLADWYKQWMELFKLGKVKESTIDVYKSLVKHIPEEIFNKSIKNITSVEIQGTINKVSGERTRQKLYELLKDIFTRAEKHKICENIMNVIDKTKHTRENGIALTIEDKEKFIEYCLKTKQYIFLVTLYQGLRKGEVLGLTAEDVDLGNNTLTINKALSDRGFLDTTKNTSSNRIMPIFNPTIEILKNINLKTKDRLFNISNAKMQSDFTKVIEELKLNPKYTIHSLRHTFITNCQDSGIPEHIIQSWVGHTIGSNVTKTVYTHIQKESNLLNINKLNDSKFYSNSTHILLTNKKS